MGRFTKLISLAITAVTLATAVLGTASIVKAQGPRQAYVVKLAGNEPELLSVFGQNVEKKFGFSSDPEFSNIFSFNSNLSLSEIQTRLGSQLFYIQRDNPVHAGTAVISTLSPSNDPGFTSNSADIDRSWGLPRAHFFDAWQKTTGARNVIVAVIDTGIDESHEDLAQASFVSGFNFLTNQDLPATGTNYDDNGHGTLVSGVIAATPNNGVGILGAAPGASLMPLKALDSDGSGNASDVAEAIIWAADHGASVINISLGGMGFAHDTVLADSISYAYKKNVVIVAAAGNDVAATGGNLDKDPVFPICDDNGENMIIGVAATDQNDQKADFSNFGKSCIDVTAPGKRILSTINHDPVTKQLSPNLYAYGSGTSLAVPFVSAEAALLKSQFLAATNLQIRDRIMSSSDNVDNLNISQCGGFSCNGLLGFGRINAGVALSQPITITAISDGDLVTENTTGTLYYINGGKKQPVSDFVRNQRFFNKVAKQVTTQDLVRFPLGSYAEPQDATLLKIASSPTVYYMSKGLKLPVTGQIFSLRGFSFVNVVTLTDNEVNSWLTASFLSPPEGALVRTAHNPTVYWVVDGSLHPINYNFFIDRGLNVFPIVIVSDNDLKSFSKSDPYIR